MLRMLYKVPGFRDIPSCVLDEQSPLPSLHNNVFTDKPAGRVAKNLARNTKGSELLKVVPQLV